MYGEYGRRNGGIMKTFVVLLVSCVLSLGTAQTLGFESRRSGGGTYVLEGLGGLAGLGAGAVCGVAAAYGVGVMYAAAVPNAGWDALTAAGVAILACGAALPACAGYGVNQVGEGMTEGGGSPAGAYIGAYVALPVAIGLGVIGNNARTSAGTITGVALGALAIPAGAVVGYNWPSGREPGLYGDHRKGRLGMPVVMLDRVERGYHVAEYGVRVQLASVSF
jgi:hypothetical protein